MTEGPPAPPGWYPEPGSGRQRYWDGQTWGVYAPPVAPPNPDDGRTLQIVGYSMAGLALALPILGLAGLVLGILTATKPNRGGHGAAIISLSVLLAVFSYVFWWSLAGA